MTREQRQTGSEHQELPAWSDDGLLDQIDTAIYAVNREGRCRRFNRAAERMFGYSQAEMLDRDVHDVLHNRRPDGTPYPRNECSLLGNSVKGKAIHDVREVMWSRNDEAIPVECSVAPVQVSGEPGTIITMKDLRPQHQAEASLQSLQNETAEILRQRDAASRVEREMAAEEAIRQREITSQLEHAATAKLREQQELLDSVVKAAPVGIVVLDAALRFRWLNQAYGHMLREVGCPNPVPGESFVRTVSATAEVERVIRDVQQTGKPFIGVGYCYDGLPKGRTYWNWSVTRLPDNDVLMMTQNVTEQTMSQQALVESDKMAAVGRLAASISHEINNPLEAVTNLLYLIHSDPTLSEESRAYVATAEDELARVSKIASQTLRFHRHAPDVVPRTPQQLIDPVLALYEGKLKSAHVRVSVDFDDAKPLVTFEGDVRQILNNLIGNAIDAMARGGDLHVRVRSNRCVRTGRSGMRITVVDSGHGMSPETAAHIFEPFYTTKGAAGSGLGLWISHTLAERHGGRLQVKSRREDKTRGKTSGTAFSLFLPSQDFMTSQALKNAPVQ